MDGQSTFADIAIAVGQAEHLVRRILRHAITRRLFNEPRKGIVTHSAASRLLAEDDLMADAVMTRMDELWPAAFKVESIWMCRILWY